MLPIDLKADQFAAYPPLARQRVVSHLAPIQQLPISFVPSLLRELIDYDFKFPVEQKAIDRELAVLDSFSPEDRGKLFAVFAQCTISTQLQNFDWINQPALFVEQLSAYLWTTGQLDNFRSAATAYGDRLQTLAPAPPLPIRRLGIAVIGQGVETYKGVLFRNLRPHGTYFSNMKPEGGLRMIINAAHARAKATPAAYGHWYIDGGAALDHDPSLISVAYQDLETLRAALLSKVASEIAQPGMGPEELRTRLARLSPADLGVKKDSASDVVLDRFKLKLLTEGSGTQIFSTAFVQWAAREALRRAQALTLVVRFAPRQRQRPMNEMLANINSNAEQDPIGSLVDADMGAYYQWINQQRLAGARESSFIVWFEGQGQAFAAGPAFPKATESKSRVDLTALLDLATT